GIGWVRRFCGEEAAQSIGQRLRPTEFRRLKAQLAACYASHFSSVDPGVLRLTTGAAGTQRQLPLSQRFVAPDLMQKTDVVANEPPATRTRPTLPSDPASGLEEPPPPIPRIEDQPRRERMRILLDNWIADANHEIVLGPAGAGKSTFLRFVALDMLSDDPK